MPRRPRDDLQPIVHITSHPLQPAARGYFGNDLAPDDVVTIKKRWRPNGDADRYFTLHDDVVETYRNFAKKRNMSGENVTIFNYEIFIRLWSYVGNSRCRIIDTEKNLYLMTSVGCRVVHSGIAQLARDMDVSVSALEKQLRLYRDIGLVVNEAKALRNRDGFIEFDVMVGWRGNFAHREAYVNAPSERGYTT